jgi:Zn-dependent peptidase ImmA (M78 family)
MATVEHTGSAERDAVGLLRVAWAPNYPTLTAPVDPIYIAQGLGLKVYTAILDEGVSGMLVKRPGLDPAIYLNKRDSKNRQRFTCAHELGHYVQRASTDDDAWEYVDERGPSAGQGTHPDEIYANGFAAALLMPAAAVKHLHRAGFTAAEMAYRLGVSVEAMKIRLDVLGLTAR